LPTELDAFGFGSNVLSGDAAIIGIEFVVWLIIRGGDKPFKRRQGQKLCTRYYDITGYLSIDKCHEFITKRKIVALVRDSIIELNWLFLVNKKRIYRSGVYVR